MVEAVVGFLIGFLLATILFVNISVPRGALKKMQQEAVSRGCAVWVPAKEDPEKNEFKWNSEGG